MSNLILVSLQALKRDGVQSAHVEFSARPWVGVWVVMGYYATFGLISLLAWNYFKTGELNFRHGLVSETIGATLVWLAYLALNVVLLPLYGWLTRYGLHRVLGPAMPQEPYPLGVPVGVWVGLALAAPMLCVLPLLYIAMGAQPWLPVLSTVAQSGFKTLGIVAYVVPLSMVRKVYGIPPRSAAWVRLGGIVMGPPILLAIIGIALAIVLGLHQRHLREAAATPISATRRLLPESGTPVGVYAAPRVQQGKDTVAPKQDQSNWNCNGRGRMLMPMAPQEFSATVIGVVPPSEAIIVIKQGQRRVNGQLDADYSYSPHVVVHPDKAPYGTNVMAVVPKGIMVTPGAHIVYTRGYADSGAPCHYFPNLVERVDPQ